MRGYRKRDVIAWMNQEFVEDYDFEAYLDIDELLGTSHIIPQRESVDPIRDLTLNYQRNIFQSHRTNLGNNK